MHYGSAKPESPDAAIGRVYPLNTHGAIVYLDRPERARLHGLEIAGGAIFVLSVFIDMRKR